MSDYPDYQSSPIRPGYGSSLQSKVAKVSTAAEEKLLNDIKGSGVFLGLILDIDGPDNTVNYGIRIKIDGETYFYDNIEDIFMLFTAGGVGSGPRMTYYSPVTGRHCFCFNIISSFISAIQVYGENGDGTSTTFVSRLYYSILKE